MRRAPFLIILVALLLVACGSEPVPAPTVEQSTGVEEVPTREPATATVPKPTDTSEPSPATPSAPADKPPEEESIALAEFDGLPLPTDRGDLFSASGACAVCHTQMADESGNDVSTDTFWRGSMMANAARDPYWRAAVQVEVLSNPALAGVIEDKCSTCHMPMARTTDALGGGQGVILGDGYANPVHGTHNLAVDGVSCTLCHQIQEDGFGEPASFSGGYAIDSETPAGERDLFGPLSVEDDLVQLMQASSGFVAIESMHVDQSELCATCHTLYTPYVDASGEVVGEFPEQMPYAEWLASSFGGAIGCQVCHMPMADGGVQLSITGGDPRKPFHQHQFVGGNAYVLKLLRTFGPEMEVTASSTQLEAKRQQVLDQLQNRTGVIKIEEVSLDGSTLTANVMVAPSTGHKLPTGFPSRRVWIHLVVEDATGQVVFESGGVAADGSIAGNDNDADPAALEPHYATIDSAEQVQIYEAIMGNTDGEVTTTLLRGAEYLKDNRLLPPGFDKGAVDGEIAVRGAALEDPDFDGGGDRIVYNVDLDGAQGPFVVSAELLYQSISYRWAENQRAFEGQQVERFAAAIDQVPNKPVLISSASSEIGD